MAFEETLQSVALAAAADLSSVQYYACAPSTAPSVSGQIQVQPTTGRGNAALGVIQDKSTAAGISCKVAIAGIGKLAAGDSSGTESSITYGTILVASSVGRGVPSTATGLHAIAVALEPLTSGRQAVITVLHLPFGQLTS